MMCLHRDGHAGANPIEEAGDAEGIQGERSAGTRFRDGGGRSDEFEGYSVSFVSIRQTHSLAPLLKGLPGDSC
jgi:hypothetical protein